MPAQTCFDGGENFRSVRASDRRGAIGLFFRDVGGKVDAASPEIGSPDFRRAVKWVVDDRVTDVL